MATREGKERMIVVTQMRRFEPPSLKYSDYKKESEGQTSRNHAGSILRMINTPAAQTTMPTRIKAIDTTRQYGTVLLYGSILESAGGAVVQNAETVASNKPFYEGLKSQHRQNSRSVDAP